MSGILVRTLIIALGLGLASWLIPGVEITGAGTLIVAALLLGLVNAIIRPLLVLLTLPITILTLGLFLLVVNAGMFAMVAAILDDFVVSGFWSALFGALIVSLTSTLASWYIGPDGRYQILVIERRD
ncbi:MAG: phage holin family protein [Gammaproteobacteria bacterium]